MGSPPSLVIAVRMARHRQTLSDQLVLGLISGGLLGPGLLIEGRDSERIRFRKLGGLLRAAPDRGEFLLQTNEAGDTLVECRVWCHGLALRRLLSAVLLGAGLAGLLLASLWVLDLAPGARWSLAVLFGFLALLGWFLVGRSVDNARLRRQVEAYVHNTTYLKVM